MKRAVLVGLAALLALGATIPQEPALASADQRARIDTLGASKRFTARSLQSFGGSAIGSLDSMATRDQKGEADDPDAYVRAQPDGERFDVRATYRVKSVASAASLDLAVSVRSSVGWWKLQVRDQAAGRWVTVLCKADVPQGSWEWRVASIDPDRMVGNGGRVRLRLIGDGGPLDVDYLGVRRTVWQPEPGTTWQWQLTGTLDTSYDVEMYDIDLFDTPQTVIDTLQAEGRVVVCYFSAGSWEEWRGDADDFPVSVLGEPLDGWEGESWLDIRQLDLLRPIMSARLDLAVKKGCDGVEPDNVDGYANNSGFGLSSADQLAYNRWLAAAAHQRGLSIGLKNDLDQVGDLLNRFDWALNEQCFQFDECGLLEPFVGAGKAVFGVEYQGAPADFCPDASGQGFSWLKKRLDLDAWMVAC